MSFEDAVIFARTWGLVLMMTVFAAVVAYALWPGNRKKFERAARLPLDEDEANGKKGH